MNTDNDEEDWTIFGDNCPCCGGGTDWEYINNDNIAWWHIDNDECVWRPEDTYPKVSGDQRAYLLGRVVAATGSQETHAYFQEWRW